MHIHTHIHKHIHIRTRNTHTYTHITLAYTHILIHTHMQHIVIQTYTYTHTYTYIHKTHAHRVNPIQNNEIVRPKSSSGTYFEHALFLFTGAITVVCVIYKCACYIPCDAHVRTYLCTHQTNIYTHNTTYHLYFVLTC